MDAGGGLPGEKQTKTVKVEGQTEEIFLYSEDGRGSRATWEKKGLLVKGKGQKGGMMVQGGEGRLIGSTEQGRVKAATK